MSHEVARSFLSETVDATHLRPGHWTQLAIAELESDALIGDVGLYLSEDGTFSELGFTLAGAEQGKGHATRAAELAVLQAFRSATVLEVRAVTDQLNRASIGVLTRARFVQTSARETLFKGRRCVELLFARGRSEV
jgi:[ribosomal protein S5]-alanine N-acetyltransferase